MYLLEKLHIGSSKIGQLIGELSMIENDNPIKNKRVLAGVCTSEIAIVFKFNKSVFDLLYRERMKKDAMI